MIFRQLDTDGDWTFGRGKQGFLIENEAIMKNIETTLKVIATECFYDQTVGLSWFQLLGSKQISPLLLRLRTSILNCYGVLAVTDVQYLTDIDRKATITYFINTLYTQGAIGGFTL